MSLVQEKFEWIVECMDDWKLSQKERNILLGFNEAAKLPPEIEERFDLISEIKTTLELVYGGDDNEQETMWLRAKISTLNHKSPLRFLENDTNNNHKLKTLVSSMNGP